jgi:hypothetical protein
MVTGVPVSGAAISPALASDASFGAVSSPSVASDVGTLASCFGSAPGPDPLSALGVAPSGSSSGSPLGVSLGAVEHSQSRQHNAASHAKSCWFLAVIMSIDSQTYNDLRPRERLSGNQHCLPGARFLSGA